MSWYKFAAIYGPGHQSGRTEYRWYEEVLSAKDKRYLFEDVFGDRDYPIGSVTKVTKLPKTIKKDKIALYESNIRHAKSMLVVLRKTTVKAKE